MGALHHHHQVGQGRGAVTDSGTPSSRPAAAVIEAMVSASRYSRTDGATPLATSRRHGPGHLLEGGEGREHGGLVGQARLELHGGLGHQGQGALRADQELGEVVAGLEDFTKRPPVRMTSPPGQHRLEAQDAVAGDAVADGPHAAGVGADVAAERGAQTPRGTRGREAEGQQRRVELLEGDARLDDRHVVVGVDVDDAVHPVEGHHDAVGPRAAAARQPGARPPGHHRHPLVRRPGRGRRPPRAADAGRHHGQRGHRRAGEGLVVGVVGVDPLAGGDVGVAHHLAQPLDDVRHGPSGSSAGGAPPRSTLAGPPAPPAGGTAARPGGPRPSPGSGAAGAPAMDAPARVTSSSQGDGRRGGVPASSETESRRAAQVQVSSSSARVRAT